MTRIAVVWSFIAGGFCVKAEKKVINTSLLSWSLCTVVQLSGPGFAKKGSGVVGKGTYVENFNSDDREPCLSCPLSVSSPPVKAFPAQTLLWLKFSELSFISAWFNSATFLLYCAVYVLNIVCKKPHRSTE